MVEIKSLKKLREESFYVGFDDPPPLKKGWIDKIREFLDLRAENRRLRNKLLQAHMACEDAGRIGLRLYAENERLQELVGVTPETQQARLSELRTYREENAKLQEKLKRSYEDYNRLHEQINEWIAKFGEQK